MPEISVIIPCHNSYKLMEKGLRSLEEQTYKDFEVIVVDDCSTDTSYPDLLNYMVKSSLRMKILQTASNSGPGPARNVGLENCQGRYVTFLDSDDWVDSDWLMKIKAILDKDDELDCVLFDFYRQYGRVCRRERMVFRSNGGYLTKRKALVFSRGTAGGKVYKTEVIMENGIRFPDIPRNEDMPFSKLAIAKCNKVYYLDTPLYYYVFHDSSLMHDRRLETEQNAIRAFDIVKRELENLFPDEVVGIFAKELLYSTVLTMCGLGKSDEDINRHLDKYEALYPDWSKNPIVSSFEAHVRLVLFFIQRRWFLPVRILSTLKRLCGR